MGRGRGEKVRSWRRGKGPIRKDEEGGIKELGMRNEQLGIGDSKKVH